MVWYRVIRGYVKQFSCGPTHIRNIQEPFMMWAEKWYCHIRTYSSLQCMVTVQYTIGFPTGDVSYGGLQFGINMRGIFKDYPSPSIHWTMFQLPLPRPLPRLCIHALISTTEKFLASLRWNAPAGRQLTRVLHGGPHVLVWDWLAAQVLILQIQWQAGLLNVFDFNLFNWQIFNFQGSGLYRWPMINSKIELSILYFVKWGFTPWCWGLRTCLLLLLVTALGGAWLLEQPENSVLEFFPPFQTLLKMMFETCNATAVAGLPLG